jgi:pyruvate/2-oxoglutarate/acetoin dehydrogenase E1 component
MSTAAQAYAMLGNQTLWDTARHCHEALRQAGVAYAVVDGVLRRTHKDFADVVELIDQHGLSRADARRLHKSVRKTFRELVLHARRGAS